MPVETLTKPPVLPPSQPRGERTVIVTGGSGSLGRAISAAFARNGDRVYCWYLTGEKRARRLADELADENATCIPIQVDLRSDDSVGGAVRQIVAQTGPVEVLVNSAAYRPIGAFLELTEESWAEVLSVNLMGAVRASRQVLPGMEERHRGRIINISGIDAHWGWGGRAHVTVSKAALDGLTRALAVEFAQSGICVNTLTLGSFRTERDPRSYPNWEEMRRFLVDRIPLGRQGEPEEVAQWCLILASPEASYMTGQEIHLNGGVHPLLRNPTLDRE
jgi:NAD(P)-dependent dehydrogenase (short-subunit alcohol dehydrogenase family)